MMTSPLLGLTYFRGRVALSAILKAMNIAQGDQVAIQAFTCVAVPEGVIATGARPLYIDIEPMGFNMDADDLLKKLTPETKAIVVQHTFGIPADMERIMQIADQRNIPVIEDCCHTLISTYNGRTVGSFGVGGFYSFEWGKPIIAGVGGSVVINDPELKNKIENQYTLYRFPPLLRRFRLFAQYQFHRLIYRPSLYWPVRSLYKKLSSLGMAEGNFNPIENGGYKDFSLRMAKHTQKVLISKIRKLEEYTTHSRWTVSEYCSRINSPAVSHPKISNDADIVFARYPLVSKNKSQLLERAHRSNVEVADWFRTPIHPLGKDQWPLVHYEANSCPNAETMAKQVITLPTNIRVKKRYIDRTVSFLNNL